MEAGVQLVNVEPNRSQQEASGSQPGASDDRAADAAELAPLPAAQGAVVGASEPGAPLLVPLEHPVVPVEGSAAEEPGEPDEEPEDEPELPMAASSSEPLEFIDESVADSDLKFDWYILKVQVNREDSIKDALLRRVKMNALDRYFKDIVVPTEDVAEFTKTGKRRVVKKKLYPGYILINLAVNDDSWFIVRETPGIGDFTGSAGRPTPMEPRDVERILRSSKVLADEEGPGVKSTIQFKKGERVRVKEGYFQNFEGDVETVDQANGRVTVMISIFGRSTPVELEHWQIELI